MIIVFLALMGIGLGAALISLSEVTKDRDYWKQQHRAVAERNFKLQTESRMLTQASTHLVDQAEPLVKKGLALQKEKESLKEQNARLAQALRLSTEVVEDVTKERDKALSELRSGADPKLAFIPDPDEKPGS